MFKRIGLFILLVFFCFLVLTPTYAVNLLDPLRFALEKWLKDVTFLTQLISTYFQPLIVILINFVLIPSLIELSILFEDHIRQSSVQSSIMRRIFFFMLLNTLLIPVTATSSALLLFDQLKDQGI